MAKSEPDAPADGTLAGEVGAREARVDHGHRKRAQPVGRLDHTALGRPRIEDLEEPGRDGGVAHLGIVLLGGVGAALDGHVVEVPLLAGDGAGDRRGVDSRNRV